MYTVFPPDSFTRPKQDRFGLVVFVRTLEQARAAMVPGDRVVRWSKYGHPSKVWRMTPRRRLTAIG